MSAASTTSTEHPSKGDRGWRPLGRWALFVVGLAGVVAGAWWVTNSRVFDLRDLRVTGNHHLSSAEVSSDAGLSSGTNVLWMSTGAIEARLERNPWIREAHVARTLPSLVTVAVEERIPVAVLSPASVLVAGDGTVLGKAPSGTKLPRLRLPGATARPGSILPEALPQLIAIRAMPADMRSVIRQVGPGPDGALAVRTREGTQVLFGDDSDAAAKWEALRGVLTWATENAVIPAYIDVRSPIAPALRPVQPATPDPGSGAGG